MVDYTVLPTTLDGISLVYSGPAGSDVNMPLLTRYDIESFQLHHYQPILSCNSNNVLGHYILFITTKACNFNLATRFSQIGSTGTQEVYFPSANTDFSFDHVQITAHTLPSGLQAVNGSHSDGNCGDISFIEMVCEDPNAIGFASRKSVLVDGIIPNLDFSDDNWAEGFFTVSRNDRTTIELGFEVDTDVIITRVEVESLECPDRGMGTSTVSLFGMEDPGGFAFPPFGGTTTLLDTVTPEATSCSVQTHTFCIPMGEQSYRYYYLVFTFSNSSDIDWLFLAEVRFLVNSSTTTSTTVTPPTTAVTPGPSATPSTGITLSTPPSSALESSTIPTPTPTPPSVSGGEPMATIPPVRATEKEAVSDAIIASTAAIIGLLIIILVVLVVVIFKYRHHQKGKGEAPKTVEAEYENVVGGSNDPEYEEIDIQERGIQMKENEAYASANMPTEPNVAYALVRN